MICLSPTGITCFLDFTCLSPKIYIDINGDDEMFIGGYKSGSDKLATVSFERASFTGTGEGLPDGRQYEHQSQSVPATIKDLPNSSGVQRIGAFYCKAEKDGDVELIHTIIMAKNSKKLLIS